MQLGSAFFPSKCGAIEHDTNMIKNVTAYQAMWISSYQELAREVVSQPFHLQMNRRQGGTVASQKLNLVGSTSDGSVECSYNFFRHYSRICAAVH